MPFISNLTSFFFLAIVKRLCFSDSGCRVRALCCWCPGAFHPGANSLVQHQEEARITLLITQSQ